MQDTKNIAVIGHLSIDRIKNGEESYDGILGGAVLYSSLAASSNSNNTVHMISTYCEDFDFDKLEKTFSSNLNYDQVVPILGKQRKAFMEYTTNFQRTSHNHARKEWLLDTLKQSPRHIPVKTLNYDGVMLVPMLPEIQKLYINWFRKNSKALICLDTSEYFAENSRDELKEIISTVDIFIPSDVELDLLLPENKGDIKKHIDSLRKFGLRALVIKRSIKGSIFVDFETDDIWKVGIRATNAIDATGAGDSFAGSLITQYISTNNLLESVKYATVVSSYCVEEIGFTGLLRTYQDNINEEIEKLYCKKESVSL